MNKNSSQAFNCERVPRTAPPFHHGHLMPGIGPGELVISRILLLEKLKKQKELFLVGWYACCVVCCTRKRWWSMTGCQQSWWLCTIMHKEKIRKNLRLMKENSKLVSKFRRQSKRIQSAMMMEKLCLQSKTVVCNRKLLKGNPPKIAQQPATECNHEREHTCCTRNYGFNNREERGEIRRT